MKSKMILYGVSVTIAAAFLIGATTGSQSGPTKIQGTHAFTFDKPIPLDLKSTGVVWRGQTYHLLQFNSIRFEITEESHLTAEVNGAVCCFDDVEYTLHGAVYDASGALLGTATAPFKVQKLWVGYVVREDDDRSFPLDFGISTNYGNAKHFALAISERTVKTPKQWEK